jgi:ABC-type multidrug transport system fused ATPase/permease subunit
LGTSGIVKAGSEFVQGLVSADRLYKLLGVKEQASVYPEEDMQERESSLAVSVDEITSIAFSKVCFAYKSPSTSFALKDLSFVLGQGTVVALVGKNGCGKSTAASLLAGLLQTSSGRIELSDGSDFSKMDKTTRKRLVQVIPQSTSLFNATILDNVRYSNPEASEEDVQQALTQANCDGFMSRLEGGVNFVVGINGCKISGGERQRLALARTLLSDPAFLVMVQAISALDMEGETAVAEAMQPCRQGDNGSKGRALLLITHHAKTLALADHVLVLKGGLIVEAGDFADLSSDPGSELCSLMPDLL